MTDFSTGDMCDAFNKLNNAHWYGDEDTPDFVEELKACAYNLVKENPGIYRFEL